MGTILLLTVAGVVISIVIGSIWHSTAVPMGRLHMRHLGFDKLTKEEQAVKIKEAEPTMPKIYIGQMVLSAIMSAAVVFIVTMSMQNGVSFMLALGFVAMNWLCFMVPVIGSQILWGNVEREIAWTKFFYDATFNLVMVMLIAVMAGLFA